MSKSASTGAAHPRHTSTNQPGSTGRPKLHFHRSLRELQDLVLLTGDFGEWQEKPNGVWRYRSEDGGGLNWPSTRGTIWFDGPPAPRDRLQRIIEARFRSKRVS